jgi:uncharacterized protein YqgQ
MLIAAATAIGLAFAAFFAFVITMRTLRRIRGRRDEASIVGFSIAELNRLYEAGKLSREEFEKAKASVLAKSHTTNPPRSVRAFEVLPPRNHM